MIGAAAAAAAVAAAAPVLTNTVWSSVFDWIFRLHSCILGVYQITFQCESDEGDDLV